MKVFFKKLIFFLIGMFHVLVEYSEFDISEYSNAGREKKNAESWRFINKNKRCDDWNTKDQVKNLPFKTAHYIAERVYKYERDWCRGVYV